MYPVTLIMIKLLYIHGMCIQDRPTRNNKKELTYPTK